LNITGYGVLDKDEDQITVVEAGVLRTNSKASMADRLKQIGSEMQAIITQLQPDAVAIEDLYSHYGHPKTAIIMGHARGVIFLKAAEVGLPLFTYASTRIKKSLTGNGRASKLQMQLMITSALGLSQFPDPPDVADALAVALCHCRALMHDNPMVTA
jgi:crossover junction endodeoxyribonuclease RuvC